MLNIYLANLGKYNEGELVGEWVELPIGDFEEVFERIGINEEYEEYFITDYDTDIEGLKIEEYSNIYELDELAEEFENLNDDDLMTLQALLQSYYNDVWEAMDNIDNYYLVLDVLTDIDLGYYYAEIMDIPSHLENYIDYEAIGRDMQMGGSGVLTDYGWLYEQ